MRAPRVFQSVPVTTKSSGTATPTQFELHAAQHGFEFQPRTATQFEFHHVVA